MRHQIIVLGAALALGLAGCETAGGGGDKMAAMGTPLDAAGLAKEFKKGSKNCKWTKPDGSKGEDFYFKTSGPYSGDADRNMGDKTIQGRWKIVGQGFYTNFGKGKKALGDWHKVYKVKKNTYDLQKSDGSKAMTMKCS
jgi:hypothetical protein